MRRARRVDLNQVEIVAGLRTAGYLVHVLSDVGRGVPDLLVGARQRWVLLEVKRPGADALTEAEATFHVAAQARRLPVFVVRSVAEAIEVLGLGARAQAR